MSGRVKSERSTFLLGKKLKMSTSVFDSLPESPISLEEEEMDGNADSESLVRPSLQLHDVEGRIHKYGGMLSRKTKNKIKNGWKKRWFRVIPGKNS